MHFPLFIAWRYLFAKKSQQVINVISWVSACGIAVGTMALIVILSVYNGFDSLVKGLYNTFDSDMIIRPAEGKTFCPSDSIISILNADKRILAVCPVVEDAVFLQYRSQQAIATLKGVDTVFVANSPLVNTVTQGYFNIWFGELEQAVLGKGLATTLGVNVNFLDPLWIYFPKKQATYSAINPTSSLNREKIFPSGIFSVEPVYDSKAMFVPIETAKRIFGYDKELSYLELRLNDDINVKKLQRQLERSLGPDYLILDRYRQNETLYKMMAMEKVIIYLILAFVLLIICCNVLGSLSLLMLEKETDMMILRSLGATPSLVKHIFRLEGWLISILGMLTGIVIGLIICFLQQHIGIVPMPGNFAVKFYPVIVRFTDVILVIVTVLTLGGLAAFLPTRSR